MNTLFALIRRFEGLRLRAYLCPAGVPTIGYGSTGPDIKLGMTITAGEAEMIMRNDAARFAAAVLKLSPSLAAYPDRLSAIADFCYNLGVSRYKASTLRRKVDAGDWEAAARELQKWVWGGGRKLPGLIARREAEASLLS